MQIGLNLHVPSYGLFMLSQHSSSDDYQQVVANASKKIRYEKIGTTEYLVAPVSMLVPGVLNGSKGPLYYPKEEVTKNVIAWNNMPLTLGHPTENGVPRSARIPRILEKFGLGYVFNAHSRNGKLDGEAWFDIDRTLAIEPSIIRKLEAGEPIELSTGLFTENVPVGNTGANYKGRRYVAVAKNYKPDHLAVLIDTRGACSIEDGCGVLVNEDLICNCGDDKSCGCGCTDKPEPKKKKRKKCGFGKACPYGKPTTNGLTINGAYGVLLEEADAIASSGPNCGIGKGGFQPGNTCAKGKGTSTSAWKPFGQSKEYTYLDTPMKVEVKDKNGNVIGTAGQAYSDDHWVITSGGHGNVKGMEEAVSTIVGKHISSGLESQPANGIKKIVTKDYNATITSTQVSVKDMNGILIGSAIAMPMDNKWKMTSGGKGFVKDADEALSTIVTQHLKGGSDQLPSIDGAKGYKSLSTKPDEYYTLKVGETSSTAKMQIDVVADGFLNVGGLVSTDGGANWEIQDAFGKKIGDTIETGIGIEIIKEFHEGVGSFKKEDPLGVSTGTMPSQDKANQFTLVKQLGGSTGAMLVKDPDTGQLYVKKRGQSGAHLENEFAAEEAYRAAGVPMADSKMYSDGTGLYKLHKYIEGDTLSELTGEKREKAIKAIQKDFAIDATLANWDVIGQSEDNIVIAEDGTPYRIDVGGSLLYRAKGAPKGAAWNSNNDEVESMRTGHLNPSAKGVFGKMTADEVLSSFESHSGSVPKMKAVLDSGIGGTGDTVGLRYLAGWGKAEELAMKEGSASQSITEVKQAPVVLSKSGLVAYAKKQGGPLNLTTKHFEKLEFLNPNGLDNGTVVIPFVSGKKTSEENQKLIAHYKSILPPGTKLVAVAASISKGVHKTHGPKEDVGLASGTKAATPNVTEMPTVSKPKAPPKPTFDPSTLDKFEGSKTKSVGKIENGIDWNSHIELSRDIPPMTDDEKYKRSSNLSAMMTSAEHAALGSWKGSSSTDYRIRQAQGTGVLTESDLHLRKVIKKATDYEGVVYRGVKYSYAEQDFEKILKAGVGGIWTEPVPMCMSRNSQTAFNFSGGVLLMKIKTKTGAYVARVGGHDHEEEVIGRPGKYYRIKRISRDVQVDTFRENGSVGETKGFVKYFVELEEEDV